MSSLFHEDNSPQPPKILNTATEINSVLRTLLNHNVPLKIQFQGRGQRYLTYLVAIDRDNLSLALDEFIPSGAERLLCDGEEFYVEAFIDGVRLNWSHQKTAVVQDTLDNHICFWLKFPEEVRHHQRRSTYRANILPEQPATITISGATLAVPVTGRLIDISATGCKVHLNTANSGLQSGQLYDKCSLTLPFGTLQPCVEARHVQSFEKQNISHVGLRFHQSDGITQRNIERYVYHLQREARRTESDELF